MEYNKLKNLTKNEAKSLKIMEIYLELLKKYAPADPMNRKVLKKDPRTTSIFKYCYKLVTERELDIKDYYNFVSAQFQIVKAQKFVCVNDKKIIDLVGIESCERTAAVNFVTLPSDKAWNRWLVWKKYHKIHEKSLETKNSEEIGIEIHKNVIKKLEESKKYLEEKCIDLGNKEKILHAVALGYVSGYFLFYFDWTGFDLMKWGIDIKFFEKGITNEVKKWFKMNLT